MAESFYISQFACRISSSIIDFIVKSGEAASQSWKCESPCVTPVKPSSFSSRVTRSPGLPLAGHIPANHILRGAHGRLVSPLKVGLLSPLKGARPQGRLASPLKVKLLSHLTSAKTKRPADSEPDSEPREPAATSRAGRTYKKPRNSP